MTLDSMRPFSIGSQDCLPESSQDCLTESRQDCLPKSSHDCPPESRQDCLPENSEDCLPESSKDCLPKNSKDCLPESRQDCLQENIEDCLPESSPQNRMPGNSSPQHRQKNSSVKAARKRLSELSSQRSSETFKLVVTPMILRPGFFPGFFERDPKRCALEMKDMCFRNAKTFFENVGGFVASYDEDFTIESFEREATADLIAVSDALASKNIKALKENARLGENAYREIKDMDDRLSYYKRRKIRVAEEQVYSKYSFGAHFIPDQIKSSHQGGVKVDIYFYVLDVSAVERGKICCWFVHSSMTNFCPKRNLTLPHNSPPKAVKLHMH